MGLHGVECHGVGTVSSLSAALPNLLMTTSPYDGQPEQLQGEACVSFEIALESRSGIDVVTGGESGLENSALPFSSRVAWDRCGNFSKTRRRPQLSCVGSLRMHPMHAGHTVPSKQ